MESCKILTKVSHSIQNEYDFRNRKEFSLDDTTFIIEPFSSPAWLEYIGQRNVKTKEKAENYLQSGPFKTYRENGFGLWLVEKRQRRGYRHVWDNEVGRVRNPDIGFAFLPGHSGKS